MLENVKNESENNTATGENSSSKVLKLNEEKIIMCTGWLLVVCDAVN
jgi:hypothetical protein